MNPGPGVVEEGGKVATAIVSTFASQPLMLAVLVFNVVMMFLVFYSGKEFRALNDRVTTSLLEQHRDMVDLLSRCVVVPAPTP